MVLLKYGPDTTPKPSSLNFLLNLSRLGRMILSRTGTVRAMSEYTYFDVVNEDVEINTTLDTTVPILAGIEAQVAVQPSTEAPRSTKEAGTCRVMTARDLERVCGPHEGSFRSPRPSTAKGGRGTAKQTRNTRKGHGSKCGGWINR